MRTVELANAIMSYKLYPKAAALTLAWRIINEYPAELREDTFRLAKGQKPVATVAGLDLKDIKELAHASDFEALELLELMTKDRETADRMLVLLSRHDDIKRNGG